MGWGFGVMLLKRDDIDCNKLFEGVRSWRVTCVGGGCTIGVVCECVDESVWCICMGCCWYVFGGVCGCGLCGGFSGEVWNLLSSSNRELTFWSSKFLTLFINILVVLVVVLVNLLVFLCKLLCNWFFICVVNIFMRVLFILGEFLFREWTFFNIDFTYVSVGFNLLILVKVLVYKSL